MMKIQHSAHDVEREVMQRPANQKEDAWVHDGIAFICEEQQREIKSQHLHQNIFIKAYRKLILFS